MIIRATDTSLPEPIGQIHARRVEAAKASLPKNYKNSQTFIMDRATVDGHDHLKHLITDYPDSEWFYFIGERVFASEEL